MSYKRDKATEKSYRKHLKRLEKELKGKCPFCHIAQTEMKAVKVFSTDYCLYKNDFPYRKVKEHLVFIGKHKDSWTTLIDVLEVYFPDLNKYQILIKPKCSVKHNHLHLLKI